MNRDKYSFYNSVAIGRIAEEVEDRKKDNVEVFGILLYSTRIEEEMQEYISKNAYLQKQYTHYLNGEEYEFHI